MIKLKLIRGRSFYLNGIFATSEKPYVEVEDKSLAGYLVSCGRFAYADVADSSSKPDSSDGAPDESWSVKQLKAYAAENGIDLDGISKQPDILAKIQEAESAIDFSADV